MVYRDLWEFGWGCCLWRLRSLVGYLFVFSLEAGLPNTLFSLPPLFPMGQHKTLFFLIYIVTVLDRPKRRNSGGVWAADSKLYLAPEHLSPSPHFLSILGYR